MLCPRRFIALALILVATLLSVGFVHGWLTDRWSSRTSEAILEMEKLPLSIPPWEGQPVRQDSDEQIFPDPSTFLVRRYVNPSDGMAATVMLTRGRPGPMVVRHLPTQCYPNSGYELVGQPTTFSLPWLEDQKVADEFWVATFKKRADDFPVTLRVYWSWSADGKWQTPARPRVTFARNWMLYKLYVVQILRDENEELEGAPVHNFVKELASAMRSSIFHSVPN